MAPLVQDPPGSKRGQIIFPPGSAIPPFYLPHLPPTPHPRGPCYCPADPVLQVTFCDLGWPQPLVSLKDLETSGLSTRGFCPRPTRPLCWPEGGPGATGETPQLASLEVKGRRRGEQRGGWGSPWGL